MKQCELMRSLFIVFIISFSFFTFIQCPASLSSEKELLSFAILNITNNVTIDDAGNVTVQVYDFTDITKLIPIITISPNATVYPASGNTVNFTNPVFYTITAQDGSRRTFNVTVNKELSHNKEIVGFTLDETEQILEREDDNLYIYVPYETDVTNIKTYIVVSDKATINPGSDEFVDFTNPQTYKVTASDETTNYFLVTVKKSPWKRVVDLTYTGRDGAGLLEFQGKMWLLGGWKYGTTCSEIWNSSDGIYWELITNAPWEGRHCAGFVAFNDAMWVISGDGFANVWKSEDGIDWDLVTDTPPWGRRYAPYVAVFKNKLWLMGGLNWWDENGNFTHNTGVKAYNDVWSSTDGKNWKLENQNTAWSPRGLIHGSVVLNNEMYIMGGGIKGYADTPLSSNTIAEYNDVWKTKDGINWVRILQHAPWKERTHFSVTTFNGNIIVNDGSVGDQSGISNETWYSPDGMAWIQVKHSFYPPTHASSLGVYENKLWLVAGIDITAIWSLDIIDMDK